MRGRLSVVVLRSHDEAAEAATDMAREPCLAPLIPSSSAWLRSGCNFGTNTNSTLGKGVGRRLLSPKLVANFVSLHLMESENSQGGLITTMPCL